MQLRRGAFDLLASPDIITEYASVLSRVEIKRLHQMTSDQIHDAVSYLLRRALIAIPVQAIRAVPEDSKDDKFIECAVAGGADVIVSGDKHLLALGAYERVRTVTPAEFIALLDDRAAAG